MTGGRAAPVAGAVPMAAQPGRVVRRLSPQPAALTRLLCFPYSGGGPASFRDWPAALAPDIELWAAALPGRVGRASEPVNNDWESLVAELTAAVSAELPGPLALFGHSLGAVLAFEVARELTRGGDVVNHLVVSARSAPDVVQQFDLPETDHDLLAQVQHWYGEIPEAVRDAPELLRRFLPMLRADLELARSYRFSAGRLLECPITVLSGASDRTVSEEQLAGWSRHTRGPLRACRFSGGHFFIRDDEHAVLAALSESLREGMAR